jgi:hypothetical protein
MTNTPLATNSSIIPQIPVPHPAVEFNLRRISENPVPNLTFQALPNGKIRVTKPTGEVYDYSCTVFKGGVDVTGSRNWGEITSGITKLFIAAAGKPIEAGQIRLAGDFTDIAAVDLKEKNVQILSAEVTYHDDDAHEWKSKTYTSASAVALKNLDNLGEEFKSQPAVTTSAPPSATQAEPVAATHPTPQATTSSPPQAVPVEEYEDVVNDDRLEACKNRRKETIRVRVSESSPVSFKTSAIYALADQLSKMENQGRTEFHNKAHDQIVNELRNTISGDLKNKVGTWKPHSNFFFQAVKAIETDPKLVQIMRKVDLNETTLNVILSKNPDQLTENEKEKLIKLYAEYIRNGGEILDDLFFRVFVSSYQAGNNPPKFQVVIIEGNGSITDRALSYPSKGTSAIIDARRCGFVYRNTTNSQYESYDRVSPFNLNTPTGDNNKYLHITPTATTTRRLKTPAAAPTTPSAAALETVRINASGRCLDMAVAYEILRIKYPHSSREELEARGEEITTIANELRVEAAKVINEGPVDDNFFFQIWASILSIPAFVPETDPGVSSQQRSYSTECVRRQLAAGDADTEIANIKAILLKQLDTIADDEKNILRKFYANYIIQESTPAPSNPREKYFNYLDSAFLHALTKIRLPGIDKEIKCAIIRDNKIHERIEKADARTELNSSNWIFLNYVRGNHYEAVDTKNVETLRKVESMILIEKEEELTSLLNIQGDTTPELIPRRLVELKIKYPKAYTALTRVMWKNDHDNWSRSPVHERLPEPGKPLNGPIAHREGITIVSPDNTVLDVEGYGNWRLSSMTPLELKNTLMSPPFSRAQINAAKLAIPSINL